MKSRDAGVPSEGSSSTYDQPRDRVPNANFRGATAKDLWLKDNIET